MIEVIIGGCVGILCVFVLICLAGDIIARFTSGK